jgi:RNA polymerase sigma-70 factor, ECF subfamily
VTDAEFEHFHAETATQLHAYLSRAGGLEAQADDLLQTAYLRLLRAPRLPEDPRARRVYLFRIARNLLRDELRRRSGERWKADHYEIRRERPALSCESRIEVRRAFDALNDRDRELLWLAYVVGLSHREIAEVAGVGEASVRVLLHRARGRFSDRLDGRGMGPEDVP